MEEWWWMWVVGVNVDVAWWMEAGDGLEAAMDDDEGHPVTRPRYGAAVNQPGHARI